MKVYISADMEGIAGITAWSEATPGDPDYAAFRQHMTREVIAACEGAHAAGATEIILRDGHAYGRNILLDDLPDYVTLLRAWSGSPMGQLQELDSRYAAVVMIGWHAMAGVEENPLSHTIALKVRDIRINGKSVSEFGLYARLAAYRGVPVAFLSGDEAVCAEVQAYNPHIETLAVSKGIGASTLSLTPRASQQRIRVGVEKALKADLNLCRQALDNQFVAEISYNTPHHAYQYSWYPGAKHVGAQTLRFESDDYFEIKRFLYFVTQ